MHSAGNTTVGTNVPNAGGGGGVRAELVCPGTALLSAVIRKVLADHGHTLQRSALLINGGDPSTEPRLLVYFDHVITDGRKVDGDRQMVSRWLRYVEIDRRGEVRYPGDEPYLNYATPTDGQRSLLDGRLDLDWADRTAEDAAHSWAIEHLAGPHFDDVASVVRERVNMRVEHFSRNRRMMRALKAMGLVEEFGEGVDRMYREMQARLMLPPSFDAGDASVTVTLYNRVLANVEERAWLLLLGAWPESFEERLVLVEARRTGQVTKRRIVQLLQDTDTNGPGRTEDTNHSTTPKAHADRLVSAMSAKRLLTRAGRAGGTHYRLSPEVLRQAGAPGLHEQNTRSDTLLREMTRKGSLSTAEAAAILNTDKTTARRLLHTCEAGLARPHGNTRARRYLPSGDSWAAEQPER